MAQEKLSRVEHMKRAEDALRLYPGVGLANVLTECLTDLMLWSYSYHVDFAKCLERAATKYQTKTAGLIQHLEPGLSLDSFIAAHSPTPDRNQEEDHEISR